MNHSTSRRRFLHHASRLAAASTALPMLGTGARAATRGERKLSFVHTHTQERLTLAFAVDDHYAPQALATLDHFLRDHYTGEVGRIDPRLFDRLHAVQQALGSGGPLEIISGYRGRQTNARLRRDGGGGVARHSLHMEGRALDVRLPGVVLAELRDAALSLRAGGVGFYAREGFVHLDTGQVRAW